jgi:hypothetical protein
MNLKCQESIKFLSIFCQGQSRSPNKVGGLQKKSFAKKEINK